MVTVNQPQSHVCLYPDTLFLLHAHSGLLPQLFYTDNPVLDDDSEGVEAVDNTCEVHEEVLKHEHYKVTSTDRSL